MDVDDDYDGVRLLFVLLFLKLFNYAAMDNPDLEINLKETRIRTTAPSMEHTLESQRI